MGHWLRKLPGVDKHFIAGHLTPVEALHEEHARLTKSIAEAETAAVRAAAERWSPVLVSECHAKYMSE